MQITRIEFEKLKNELNSILRTLDFLDPKTQLEIRLDEILREQAFDIIRKLEIYSMYLKFNEKGLSIIS